jgi:hypothetical protein
MTLGCLKIESVNEGDAILGVMPGLDPGIHDEPPQKLALRKTVAVEPPHGLPGQARQ